MGNTTIEREVVSMSFDTKEFLNGIKDSLLGIQRLKTSMNLTDVSKRSYEDLSKMSRVDFNPLASGLDAINSKLSVLGVIGATVVQRLVNSVLDASKKLFNTLVMTPLLTGLEEYETQLNAVQTILANTSKDGTTLEDVTAALDELNLYADKTIYNFTQMTDSIGKFTTAGVDLDTSVQAIKGIANVAAVSGSNAQQASTAMYQLSQAISSGTIRLQDWISVENAGMGGEILKNALLETARVHGVAVDQILEAEGGFRNSLKENWLTADIMLETLSKFTGDLTDAQLESMGYTEEQIVEIQKMAVMANDAATKIKTLTQLKDTMAEAMQSGWSETWRIVFGDFEEAKTLWGNIGDYFGDIISSSSDARNEMLGFWKAAGGRNDLIDGVMNVIKAARRAIQLFGIGFNEIFDPIRAIDIFNFTRRFKEFSESIQFNIVRSNQFKRIVKGLASIFDILRMAIVAIVKPIKEYVASLLPSGDAFLKNAAGIADMIIAFRDFIKESGIFDVIVNGIINKIKSFVVILKTLKDRFLSLEVIKRVADYFKSIEKSDIINFFDRLRISFNVLRYALLYATFALRLAYNRFMELEQVKKILAWFEKFSLENIRQSFSDMGNSAKELWASFINSDVIQKTLEYFQTFDGRRFTAFFTQAREELSIFEVILDKVKEAVSWVSGKIGIISPGIAAFAKSVKDSLVDVLDYLIENSADIDYNKLFEIVKAGIAGGIVIKLVKFFKGGWLGDILSNIFGEDSTFGSAAIGALDALQSTLTSFQNNLKADTLLKISLAIGVLVGSIALLTLLDQTKLLQATAAVAVMIGTLFGGSGALSLIDVKAGAKMAVLLIALSGALMLLSQALIAVGNLDPDQMAVGLGGVAGGLTALTGALAVMSKAGGGDSTLLKRAVLLKTLAVALSSVALSVEAFGLMDLDVIAKGLIAVGVGLGELVGSMHILSKGGDKDILKASVAIAILSGSLLILAEGIERFGTMDFKVLMQGFLMFTAILGGFVSFSRGVSGKDMIQAAVGIGIAALSAIALGSALNSLGSLEWEVIGRGLIALAGALAILVIATNLMKTALPGAIAMVAVSAAMFIMAKAMEVLGALSWDEILHALAAMAGVFLVLGLAGLLLAPVVPVLLALGAAMLLLGIGAAALAGAFVLLTIGLASLAAGSIGIAAAIKIVGDAIIEILPRLGEAIALALVSFIQTIADQAPALLEAFKKIILTLIQAIKELVPEIVKGALTIILTLLQAIAEKLPDILQAGYDILLEFLKGIADNIDDVIEAGLSILTSILDGIAKGIPDLVDSAFNLVLVFINSLADATDEYLPQILEATQKLGEAIIDGIGNAIAGGLQRLKEVVIDLGGSIIDWLKEVLGIRSPSTKAAWIASMFVLGFLRRMSAGAKEVRRSLSNFGKEAQNGIDSFRDQIVDYLSNNMDMSPVITPVLDLGLMSDGLDRMNNIMRSSNLSASISNREEYNRGLYNQTTDTTQGDNSRGITYIQNNYSPESLSIETIYRKTRMQLSRKMG